MTFIDLLLGSAVAVCLYLYWQHNKAEEAKKHSLQKLKRYNFPYATISEFKKQYKDLNDSQIKIVENALKDFFALTVIYPNKKIAMTSRVVDDLWHIFLENKHEYNKFCQQIINKQVQHIEDPKAEKGLNKGETVTKINKSVVQTYKMIEEQKNNKDYSFQMLNSVYSLFLIDTFLNLDYGYFYDDNSFKIIKNYHLTNQGSGSSCSSTSSCSSGSDSGSSCGGGSCSGGGDGGGCGGGCGGGGD